MVLLMKKIIRSANILLLAAAFAGTSCTQDFDLELESTPVAVINAFAQPDAPLSVSVTHSWPSAGPMPSGTVITDAEVTASVNGDAPVALTYDPATRQYVSPFICHEGDEISIAADSHKYGPASGSTTVPGKIVIENVERSAFLFTDYDSIIAEDENTASYLKALMVTYKVTFRDPSGLGDYYLLDCDVDCDDPITKEDDSYMDAVFGYSGRPIILFTDRSIDGKSYTITFSRKYLWIDIIRFDFDPVNHINIYHISHDYYLYALSMNKKYGSVNNVFEDFGIGNIRDIYTNVSSGGGLIGAGAVTTHDDDISDLLDKYAGELFP